MSDNQKPSRDTGEEVCGRCGGKEDAAVHHAGAPAYYDHPYKPAPKATVREDREGWLSREQVEGRLALWERRIAETPDDRTDYMEDARKEAALCRMALSALKGDTK